MANNLIKFGSFTKASEALFRTQSDVSIQIKSLENELGCQLIERIGRHKLILTPAGERFYQYCVKFLEEETRIISELKNLKCIQTGHIAIAGTLFCLYDILIRPLKIYKKLFPNIEITVLDKPPKNIIKLVREGDILIGICLESIIPKDLDILPWKKTDSVLIVSKNHPITKIERIQLNNITEYPLILPSKEFVARMKIDEKFEQEGLSYRLYMESSNIFLTIHHVKQGFGIGFAIVPKGDSILNQNEIKTININHLVNPNNISIMKRKGRILVPYEKVFLDTIIKN